jgi:hypothetical protein
VRPMTERPTIKYKSRSRSAVTNGSALLPGDTDHRSKYARRLRDVAEMYTSDLGGPDNVSVAEAAMIRRAAVLIIELECMEAQFANDGGAQPALLDLYGRTAGNLRRCLEATGLKRRPRDVTPDLRDYVAARSEEE